MSGRVFWYELATIKSFKADILSISPSSAQLNFRIPGHFGPPHLHVSGGFEDQGITQ